VLTHRYLLKEVGGHTTYTRHITSGYCRKLRRKIEDDPSRPRYLLDGTGGRVPTDADKPWDPRYASRDLDGGTSMRLRKSDLSPGALVVERHGCPPLFLSANTLHRFGRVGRPVTGRGPHQNRTRRFHHPRLFPTTVLRSTPRWAPPSEEWKRKSLK